MSSSEAMLKESTYDTNNEATKMSQRLGDLLVSENLLTSAQLEKAIEAQCLYGGRLGTNIVELELLSEDRIAKALSRKLQLPYIDPQLLMKIPPEVIKLIPKKLACKHQIIPCRLERKRLYLAMSDPTNLTIIDALAFRLGFVIIPVVVPEVRLMLALKKYYSLELSFRLQRLSQKLAKQTQTLNTTSASDKSLESDKILELAEEDILVNDDIDEETWPLLSEKESFDMLSDQEYQELINMPDHLRVNPEEKNHPEADTVIRTAPKVEALSTEDPPFTHFCKQLKSVENRDDIANAIIAHVSQKSRGVALLLVKDGEVHGWKGAWEGKSLDDFEQLQISLTQPSVLQTVSVSKAHYLGPLPMEVDNILLSTRFNHQTPESVLVMPLTLGGRLVCLLYLQDFGEDILRQLPEYQKLIYKVSMAFEILILKNKILMG